MRTLPTCGDCGRAMAFQSDRPAHRWRMVCYPCGYATKWQPDAVPVPEVRQDQEDSRPSEAYYG